MWMEEGQEPGSRGGETARLWEKGHTATEMGGLYKEGCNKGQIEGAGC